MYRKLRAAMAAVITLPILLSACNAGKDTGSREPEEKRVVILRDTNFKEHISISSRTPTVPTSSGVLKFDNTSERTDIVWQVAQWYTKYNLGSAKLEKTENTYVYKNEGKIVAKEIGENGAATITLGVFGGNEYTRGPRKEGQSWPHLLLEQSMKDKVSMDQLQSIDFSLDVRISQCNNLLGEAYDPSLHCAQTTAYFLVSDQNTESQGYNDFFWFGIPIFDSRYEYPPGSALQDKGAANTTGKFIYVPKGKEILKQPLSNGNWEEIRIDLLPYLQKAYDKAQELGFLQNTQFKDVCLASFNLGWEVTGTFDCEMQIKNLSCTGKPAEQ